jgi:hypothetical protein
VDTVRARLVDAGLTPSDGLTDAVENLMGALILQGQARYRLHPVLPPPASAPLRLDETARRMVEVSAEEGQACTFNIWHETHLLSPLDRHLLPLLDGTRDRDALLADLLAAAPDTTTSIERDAVVQHVDALPQHLAELKLAPTPTVDV